MVFLAFVLAGCAKDDGESDTIGNENSVNDSFLIGNSPTSPVVGSVEAWIFGDRPDGTPSSAGRIFYSNGTFASVYAGGGNGEELDWNNCEVVDYGIKWKTSGDTLTLKRMNGEVMDVARFSVAGDKLTMFGERDGERFTQEYVKRNITIVKLTIGYD